MSTIDSTTYEGLGVEGAWSRWAAVAAPAAAVIGAAYGPLFVEFFTSLWTREYYQHFPFVLAAFAWLMGTRCWTAPPLETPASSARRGTAIALAALAWGLLALAYLAPSPWLAYLSFMLLTAGFVTAFGLWRSTDGLWGAWALLWLVLPPPLNRDQALVTALQRVSSQASSFVLDAVGVNHLMEGNTLQLPGKQLFVDEACSGIISVMSIIACAVIFGVWRRHRALHIAALAAAGVGWATLMNTLRISLIAIAYGRWGVDWTAGAPHEILSLCVFLATFLALISTDVLLTGMMAPIAETWDADHAEPVRFGGWLIRLWDKVQGHAAVDDLVDERALRRSARQSMFTTSRPRVALLVGALLAFAALPSWHVLAGGAAASADSRLSTEEVQASIERALACDANSLPQRMGETERVEFAAHERPRDDLMGAYSRSYVYRDPRGRTYMISCDFPYEGGWHELTVCYRGVGWELDKRTVVQDLEAKPGPPWQRMEASFAKPAGLRAFLAVCAFDEAGHPIDLPTMSLVDDAWKALTQRREVNHQIAFQVQVWTTAGEPISEHQRQIARELLLDARQRFHQLIAPPPAAAMEVR
jgi:exosortase